MKIQVDESLYLTGNYCKIGSLDNSIDMESLPDDEVVYYPAYQILSKQVDKPITVYESVEKEREIEVPVLDEEGNETGEYTEGTETYTEVVPVEKIIQETVYYYQLDESKLEEIMYKIDNPDPVDNETEYEKIQKELAKQNANIEYIALATDIDIWSFN